MSANERLVVVLREAAHSLAAKGTIRDLELTLQHVVVSAVDTVPGVVAGGLTMIEAGEITSRHPTSEAVGKLDRLQSELREGPCVTAVEDPPEDGIVVARDLAGVDGERWPHFAPQAAEAGFRALLSTQLTMGDGGVRAALNLYAAEPDVFDAEARLTAALFAIQAATLLYGSEEAGHLQRALDSRDVIGQAKGILMERFTVDDGEAFQMLVRSSQDTNTKLVDVAQRLRHEARARRAGRDAGPDG